MKSCQLQICISLQVIELWYKVCVHPTLFEKAMNFIVPHLFLDRDIFRTSRSNISKDRSTFRGGRL